MNLTIWTLLLIMFALGLAIGVVLAVGALLFFQVKKLIKFLLKTYLTKISNFHSKWWLKFYKVRVDVLLKFSPQIRDYIYNNYYYVKFNNCFVIYFEYTNSRRKCLCSTISIGFSHYLQYSQYLIIHIMRTLFIKFHAEILLKKN